MADKYRLIKIAILLAIAFSIATVFLYSPPVATGVTSKVEDHVPLSSIYDPSIITPAVQSDAEAVSRSLFGDDSETNGEFVHDLLGTYLASKDKDIVIFFNPGGWGWRFIGESPSWPGIYEGIAADLERNGMKPLLLEYRRSNGTLSNNIDELMADIGLYPQKTRILAARVEFLTSHLPDLRVILAGESNGTIICDEVMRTLKDNPRVLSIQTGTPFWHTNLQSDRVLIINHNGTEPDTFSEGNFFTMLSQNFEVSAGFTKRDMSHGEILNSLSAPGHLYFWSDAAVRTPIEGFLSHHFGTAGK